MKEIIAIKSAAGSYFEVGKNATGYYLRNRYTEIPNEFQYYDASIAQSFFEKLCDWIPDCEEVFSPSGHPNSCMYVIYSDGTKKLFKQQEGIGKNLCAYTSDAAEYSEFLPSYALRCSELLTTHHLRDVCREGKEHFDYLFQIIKDLLEDDDTWIVLGHPRNGETTIVKNILGLVIDPFVSISEDGEIIETGGLRFVEALKNHNVRIVRGPHRFKA